MFEFVSRLVADDSGVTAIEYALLASLLSVSGMAWFEGLGASIAAMFGTVETELADAVQAASGDPIPGGGDPIPGGGGDDD